VSSNLTAPTISKSPLGDSKIFFSDLTVQMPLNWLERNIKTTNVGWRPKIALAAGAGGVTVEPAMKTLPAKAKIVESYLGNESPSGLTSL
jgi:hypothetical protein